MEPAPFMRLGHTLCWLLLFLWTAPQVFGEESPFLPDMLRSKIFRPQRASGSKPSRPNAFRLITAGPTRGDVVTFVQFDPPDDTETDSKGDDSGVRKDSIPARRT